MALGLVSVINRQDIGGLRLIIADVQLSSGANWTAAGEAFGAAQIPNVKGDIVLVLPQPNAAAGVNSPVVAWDPVTQKLLCYGTAGSASGLTAIAGATDLSAMKARVLILCTGIG